MLQAVFLFAVAGSLEKPLLNIHGVFLEGCSCKGSCAFESTGAQPGCHGLGGYRIDHGSYGGKDISDCRVAYVTAPGDALFIYLDAPPSKRATVESLARALFADGFGKLQEVANAAISITGGRGAFNLKIDGGKTAALAVSAVRGGDGKGFVLLKNVYGDPYDELCQAKVVNATFHSGGHRFELAGSSAFFQDKLTVKKRF